MGEALLSIQKFKNEDSLTELSDHLESYKNVEFVLKNKWTDIPLTHAVAGRIEDVRQKNDGKRHMPRVSKQGIILISIVATADTKSITRILSSDLHLKMWINQNYKFVSSNFGIANIIKLLVHLENGLAHIHILIVPITDKGKVGLGGFKQVLYKPGANYGKHMAECLLDQVEIEYATPLLSAQYTESASNEEKEKEDDMGSMFKNEGFFKSPAPAVKEACAEFNPLYAEDKESLDQTLSGIILIDGQQSFLPKSEVERNDALTNQHLSEEKKSETEMEDFLESSVEPAVSLDWEEGDYSTEEMLQPTLIEQIAEKSQHAAELAKSVSDLGYDILIVKNPEIEQLIARLQKELIENISTVDALRAEKDAVNSSLKALMAEYLNKAA